jgi:hypothetical protein
MTAVVRGQRYFSRVPPVQHCGTGAPCGAPSFEDSRARSAASTLAGNAPSAIRTRPLPSLDTALLQLFADDQPDEFPGFADGELVDAAPVKGTVSAASARRRALSRAATLRQSMQVPRCFSKRCSGFALPHALQVLVTTSSTRRTSSGARPGGCVGALLNVRFEDRGDASVELVLERALDELLEPAIHALELSVHRRRDALLEVYGDHVGECDDDAGCLPIRRLGPRDAATARGPGTRGVALLRMHRGEPPSCVAAVVSHELVVTQIRDSDGRNRRFRPPARVYGT